MRMAKSYFKYLRNAKSRHGVHSPFVYNLIEDVIKPSKWEAKQTIKDLRKAMLIDNRAFIVEDLGAGSRKLKGDKRIVKDIARISSGSLKQCGLLFRLAEKLECKTFLELGSNLGITTASLAMVPGARKVISLEGDPSLAEIAQENLNSLNVQATIIQGAFESELKPALESMVTVDFAYIDGNHSAKPTLTYFDLISQHCTASSVIVIGDIHWSEDMEAAWAELKTKPGVRVTIDLFDMGLVFFNPSLSKEDFIIQNL